MTDIKRVVLNLLAVGLLCASLVQTARLMMAVVQTPGNSFVSYYTVSWLAARGEFTPDAYNNEWFVPQVRRAMQNPDARDLLGPNPPPILFMALPLAPLPPKTALVAWLVLTVVAYALVWGIGVWWWRRRGLPFAWWAALIVLALMMESSPFRANIAVGQIYGFMVLFVAVSLYGLKRGQAWLAGGAFALALLFKTAGIALLGWLVLRRQWRVLGWVVGVAAVVSAFSLLWVTPDVWRAYLDSIGSVSNAPTQMVTAFQTTLGFFSHFLRYDEQWNPAPIANMPVLARTLYLTVTIGAVALTAAWLLRYPVPLELGAGALLALGTISTPAAEEYHFVMMVIPLAALAITWGARDVPWRNWRWAVWGILLIVLFVPLPYKDPRLTMGWWSLLAYPRLYGAWLLWGVCLGVERGQGERGQGKGLVVRG